MCRYTEWNSSIDRSLSRWILTLSSCKCLINIHAHNYNNYKFNIIIKLFTWPSITSDTSFLLTLALFNTSVITTLPNWWAFKDDNVPSNLPKMNKILVFLILPTILLLKKKIIFIENKLKICGLINYLYKL